MNALTPEQADAVPADVAATPRTTLDNPYLRNVERQMKLRIADPTLMTIAGEERGALLDALAALRELTKQPPAPGASAAVREKTGHLIQALNRVSFMNALDESALTTIKEVNVFLSLLAPTAPQKGPDSP